MGNLNIIEQGSEDIAIAECCLKADGGSLYIKNGNLDLRSWFSCCMYADNGIYITGGNIATRTSSMGGNLALSCKPEFDSNQYKVETSTEINADTSVEMDAWNGTDDLSSFYRVNFTDLTFNANTPSESPTVAPSATPTVTPTATPAITTSKSISVKKVSWKSLKNKKKKKAVASWKKVSKADGYQLQYATNKKFKAKKNIQTKKTKYTIKKLKKKTYYVRVRAYKLDGQKKVYGKWSKIKKVTIKK